MNWASIIAAILALFKKKDQRSELEIMLERIRGAIPDNVFNELPVICETYQIDTVLRLAHFLSQCSHESGNFTVTTENLNYSSAALVSTFSKYFPGNLSEEYARKPEKIANRVYANRIGNGNEASGDGWKYRGRGYIQLTGRGNYSEFNATVADDVVDSPELVSSTYPLLSAAWFWDTRSLNVVADRGDTEEVIRIVTKKINGGYNGLADRRQLFYKFYSLFTVDNPTE